MDLEELQTKLRDEYRACVDGNKAFSFTDGVLFGAHVLQAFVDETHPEGEPARSNRELVQTCAKAIRDVTRSVSPAAKRGATPCLRLIKGDP